MKIRALCVGALMCGCLALGACATPAGQFAGQPADTTGQPAAQASNSPAETGPAASQAVQPQPTADDFVPEKIIDASRVFIPQSFIDEAVANVAAYQNRSIQGVPYAPVPLEEMTPVELWRVQEMTWLRAFGKGTVTEWKEEDLDPDSKALIDRCKALQEAQALGDPIPSDSQVDLAGDGRTITVRYENSRSDEDGPVSYTHLDVYKRQGPSRAAFEGRLLAVVRAASVPGAIRVVARGEKGSAEAELHCQ